MRLVIGGPTRDLVPASFAVDFAELYAYTLMRGPWQEVFNRLLGSTYIHVGRERVAEEALSLEATHLLWLDTDMSFPRDLAVRLARHERGVVAANYVMRHPSRLFTARRDGQPVVTTDTSTGLEVVDAVGFGACLMRLDLLRGLPRPWFRHGLNTQFGDVGEDIMCCRALRAAGHQIYIDHDLSKEMGHVGLHTYRTTDSTRVEVAV